MVLVVGVHILAHGRGCVCLLACFTGCESACSIHPSPLSVSLAGRSISPIGSSNRTISISVARRSISSIRSSEVAYPLDWAAYNLLSVSLEDLKTVVHKFFRVEIYNCARQPSNSNYCVSCSPDHNGQGYSQLGEN